MLPIEMSVMDVPRFVRGVGIAAAVSAASVMRVEHRSAE
jgi:hypothetical protein